MVISLNLAHPFGIFVMEESYEKDLKDLAEKTKKLLPKV